MTRGSQEKKRKKHRGDDPEAKAWLTGAQSIKGQRMRCTILKEGQLKRVLFLKQYPQYPLFKPISHP